MRLYLGGVKPVNLGGMAGFDAAKVTLNGSSVQVAFDQSGNHFDCSQLTPSSQPAYTASSINGLPAITFIQAVSSGKALVGTSNYAGGSSGAYSLLACYKSTNNSTWFGGALTLGNGIVGFDTATVGLNNANQFWAGGGGYGNGDRFSAIAGRAFVFGYTYDGHGNIQTYLNGQRSTCLKTPALITINSPTALLIGPYAGSVSSSWSNVPIDVGECWAYARALAPNEIVNAQLSLMVKFGLVTIPSRTIAIGRSLASSRNVAVGRLLVP